MEYTLDFRKSKNSLYSYTWNDLYSIMLWKKQGSEHYVEFDLIYVQMNK